MSKPLHHDVRKGLNYWSNIKARAKKKDTELFKHFEGGKANPYTFERIIEIAVKMIGELEQIKIDQENDQ